MNYTGLTIDDLAEIIRPHNERILAQHRADEAEARLAAANKIIAEYNNLLASVHASLCAALDFIFICETAREENAGIEIIKALVMIEGRRK